MEGIQRFSWWLGGDGFSDNKRKTMTNRGKKYKEKEKLIDRSKLYSPEEAVELIKKTSFAQFDEGVDLSVKLGVDVKRGGGTVRGMVALPHGTGKKVKVGVIAKADKIKEAEEAGAEVTGGEDLIEKIKSGFLDFDVLVATPDMMSLVGRLGKILGQRGLMPNPKAGTVTFDIKGTVKEIKAGKSEFKADKSGIIHMKIGKVSFDEDKLVANLKVAFEALAKAKTSAVKGTFIKSLTLSSTMGPGIRIDPRKSVEV